MVRSLTPDAIRRFLWLSVAWGLILATIRGQLTPAALSGGRCIRRGNGRLGHQGP